jgi:transposase InsO family protein
LIHHSDRGSQYCALEYTSLLDRSDCTPRLGQNMLE